MKNNIVEISNVSKSFKYVKALDRIYFDIKEHSITGLLGPNGSGKSTLIRSILGLIDPDGGTIKVLGKTPNEMEKNLVSYLPESLGLYGYMTVSDEIVFWLRLKGLSRQDANIAMKTYLELLDIEFPLSKRTSQLSKGQQQRVALVIALASNPKFLVLDEPFSGLDPIGMDKMSAAIKATNNKGTTIMISTHMIEYAGNICSDLCFINKGHILKSGSTKEIANSYRNIKVKLLETVTPKDVDKYFPELTVNFSQGEIIIPDNAVIREALKEMGALVLSIENLSPDFRDIFKMLNTKQN